MSEIVLSRKAPPLAHQLRAVAMALVAVRSGSPARVAIASTAEPLRDGVQALTFQVLRNLGRAESLRNRLVQRLPPPIADALLCVVLSLAWSDEDRPYEFFTLVNQAVEAAKQLPGAKAQAGFINACLRRFLREKNALISATDKDPVAQWNHPDWWIVRLQKNWPHKWAEILLANNCQAPLTLRINQTKTSRDAYLAELSDNHIQAKDAGPFGVTLEKAVPVQNLPGFFQGKFSVQDYAGQLAAPLLLTGLNVTSKRRVLDACAAPGGKTAHLLEIGNVDVTALDIDPARCGRIQQNLDRLGLSAQVSVGDAAQPGTWWDGVLFDAILLDAPCTASGIVRRHPDVRWLRRESDVKGLATTQAALLKALWPLVKPRGRLLYCTCSVFPEEGSLQIQTFLKHNTDARLLPSPGHLIPQLGVIDNAVPDNRHHDHDGFFLALLEKH